jgi:hypothetical protein
MASEVDICNLALAYLGDTATVASIDPPEGSAQSEHCARFYPIARDTLLNMHAWNFASRRVVLAQVTQPYAQWRYAYAAPGDMMYALSVIPHDAHSDYAVSFWPSDNPAWLHNYSPVIAAGQYVPQPYSVETDSSGNKVIYTDLESAMLRYQALVTDTTRFSPLFVNCLSWHLASMLAGPVIKGDQGSAQAGRCMQMMAQYLAEAKRQDSAERNIKVEHIVPWSSGR